MEDEIRDMLTRLAEISDDELAQLESDLIALAPETAEGIADEDLALLAEIDQALGEVRTEITTRTESKATREAQAADLLAKIRPIVEPEPEIEVAAEPVVEPEVVEPQAQAAAVETPAVEPQAQVAAITARQAAQHRPANRAPRPRKSAGTVVAAADVPGVPAGRELDGIRGISDAMTARARSLQGSRGFGKVLVASIRSEYPDARMLTADSRDNWRKVQEVIGQNALTASGGYCAPLEPRYDVPVIAEAGRPIKADLPRFAADRGGFRYVPAPTFASVATAVDVWTAANDASPQDPTVKPCLAVSCEGETTVTVDAITRCLQVGNFLDRTFPERVDALVNLTIAQWARLAEDTLWNTMCTGSTALTSAEGLGAARDVLTMLGRAGAIYRNQQRMDPQAVLRVMAPAFLRDMMRVDFTRQIPGDSAVSLTDAQIQALFEPLHLAVTWSWDGGGQQWGAQIPGSLLGWPDTVELLLFHEGAWGYIDGGTLDLGITRDSTLNATNDFQMFAESWENVALFGLASWCITADVCPSGKTSLPVAFDPCYTGS